MNKNIIIAIIALLLSGALFGIGIYVGFEDKSSVNPANCHIVTSCTPEIKYLERDCPDCPATDCIKEIYQAKLFLNKSLEAMK